MILSSLSSVLLAFSSISSVVREFDFLFFGSQAVDLSFLFPFSFIVSISRHLVFVLYI